MIERLCETLFEQANAASIITNSCWRNRILLALATILSELSQISINFDYYVVGGLH